MQATPTIQRTPEGLDAAQGGIVKDSPGPVAGPDSSQFTLKLSDPPGGRHYHYRWSVRDADDNAYLVRSTEDGSVAQHYGPSKQIQIGMPSLQAMYDAGVGKGCKVLCRVVETGSTEAPGRSGGDTRQFSFDFDFAPDPAVFRRKPQDVQVVAWHGDIDYVTWLAAAVRIGEIQITGLDQLVPAIQAELKDRHYVRRLEIIGHGMSGFMSPNLSSYTIAGVESLKQLTPLFGDDSTVRLEGCEVAQGAVGRRFISQLASMWGVPVSAQTSYVHALGWYDLGVEQTAMPGETLGTDADIVADQVFQAVQNTTVISARIVLKQLETARNDQILWDVVHTLQRNGQWPAVREQLEYWQATAVVPWFGEDASISERIDRLGILRGQLGDFPIPADVSSMG